MFRKFLVPAVLAVGLAAAPVEHASAHEHHDGLGLALLGAAVIGGTAAILSAQGGDDDGQPVYVQQGYAQPVYAQPVYAQPVYAAPQVVYAQPVYAAPQVVYAAPPPVVYAAPYPTYGYGYGYRYR